MRDRLTFRSLVVVGSLLFLMGLAPSVHAANFLAGPKVAPQKEGIKKQSKKPVIKKDSGRERNYYQWDTPIGDWVSGMERPMSVPEFKGLDRFDSEIER